MIARCTYIADRRDLLLLSPRSSQSRQARVKETTEALDAAGFYTDIVFIFFESVPGVVGSDSTLR